MDTLSITALIARWAHILTAIVIVGGAAFMRLVVANAASALPEKEHDEFRERMLKRWRPILHSGILIFLVSGLYNYLVVAVPLHKGDGLYHGLMGTKILLALVAFFLASVLAGKSAKFEPMRRQRKRWLTVLLAITTAIVLISGFLKVRSSPPPTVPLKIAAATE